MSYYDRWNDQNREARKAGERDGERGYGYDYELQHDYYSERGAAYQDGVREGERARERREEELREEEAQERRAYERMMEQRRQEEEQYEQQREQEDSAV